MEVSTPMIAYENMIFEYHMILGSALWFRAPKCFIQSGSNSKPRFLCLWDVWTSWKPAQKEEHGRLWLLWPSTQWSRPQQKLPNRFQPLWRLFESRWPWVQSCEGHERSLLWLLKFLQRKAAFLWARDKSSKRRLDCPATLALHWRSHQFRCLDDPAC